MQEISDSLYCRLMEVEHEEAVNILLIALGLMQSNNGQSVQECIHIAMVSLRTENGYVVRFEKD